MGFKMKKKFDPTVMGSDLPRSRKQYLTRKFAKFFVNLCGMNKPGPIKTEIVQQINPIAKIPTKKGNLLCKAD